MPETNWDEAIDWESKKIENRAKIKFSEILSKIDDSARKLGCLFDKCVNDCSVVENRDGVNWHVVRRSDKYSDWESTFSSVNMSFPIILKAILKGQYWVSTGMLRQAIEGYAQLSHILSGRRNDPLAQKRAPNINHLNESLRRIYNEISSVTHLSKREDAHVQSPVHDIKASMISMLPYGAALLPTYEPKICEALLELCLKIREYLYLEFDKYFKDVLYPNGYCRNNF